MDSLQFSDVEGYGELLPRVLDAALGHLDELAHRPVRMPQTRARLHELLGGPLPLTSTPAEKVLETLVRGGQLGASPSGSPRYFGYVVGGTLPIALAADWLTSVWDQCGVIYDMSPLTGTLEEICGEWLVDLFGLPVGTSTAFTPGCTYANILSLTAARHAVLERHGWNVREQGMQGAPTITVLANERIHASVRRALNVLGLSGNLRKIETDADGRILPIALERGLKKASGAPLIVCGQVGDINTGAIEFLQPLCEQVHDAGGWVHLDAAFGLWAAATDMRHTLLAGLENADSWATDAHKWLNVPYDSGIAFIADKAAHRAALAMSPDYLQHNQPRERHTLDWGLSMSARSRVIPIWAALTQLGKDGVARMVQRHCDQAKRFARLLAEEPGVEIANNVTLNQIAVRFHHPTHDTDTHTQNVTDAFQHEGIGWAQTSIHNERKILRLSIINWATTEDDIDRAAESLLRNHRRLIHQGDMARCAQSVITNHRRIKEAGILQP
ncbi:pyridoxal phosphate-dependent decarboxylase family protein [Arthrobacter bambusae]|uniref:Glutamate/tyrosine decarboxylase-like PLP-dependent enzyme n=1 Tax=Arthrobacter bambusae TaxID=1338426 RepID=A0AAW8DDU6_9MICC|nr:pyridoxal-dependent decarboxylase [Arthrobacter bambusae]MDP9904678.1 glutamate/tyrosine decarboxylase-like PLP-dependent enzyme [Arthrobacter bambusae]MDQ0129494.1 glutamate/tyrosine decarboxylase-like PLP-dependent enzyme [Arthrobacter bambusae]MDQ0180893.1 glutamate/tyrosine decarboxylase-like PLP-dependent enzyme [Arthrobacter bambusae]